MLDFQTLEKSFVQTCNKANAYLKDGYDTILYHVQHATVSDLLYIMEHRYDDTFLMQLDKSSCSDCENVPVQIPISSLMDDFRNLIFDCAKNELHRRLLCVNNQSSPILTVEYLLEQIMLKHEWLNASCLNLDSPYYTLDVLGLKIMYSMLYLTNTFELSPSYSPKDAVKDLVVLFPNDKDELLHKFGRTKVKASKLAIADISEQFYHDVLSITSTYVEHRDIDFTAYANDVLELLVEYDFNTLVYDVIDMQLQQTLVDTHYGSLEYDSDNRAHLKSVTSICPYCHDIRHAYYYAGYWRWWHHIQCVYPYDDDTLTQDELLHYGLVMDASLMPMSPVREDNIVDGLNTNTCNLNTAMIHQQMIQNVVQSSCPEVAQVIPPSFIDKATQDTNDDLVMQQPIYIADCNYDDIS